MLFKKLNWQNVLGNSRRQSSTGSQNLAALISKAVSCKRQNLAHLMELMSTKPEPEDLVSYSFHVRMSSSIYIRLFCICTYIFILIV